MRKAILPKVIVVAGARPNFMKVAPLMKEFKKNKKIKTFLLHTGQHYDFKMSDVFFRDLEMPSPDIYLGTKPGSHARQTAGIMAAFEKTLLKERPRLVVVVGDVNSTMACTLSSVKLGIKVAHVEAGLRSFDGRMPEEVNRRITDRLSDYLFVTEPDAVKNLKKEGISGERVFFVGNVMIDCLLSNLEKIKRSKISGQFQLKKGGYGVLTLHRPSNVDTRKSLLKVLDIVRQVCRRSQLIYPIHPRTKSMLQKHGLENKLKQIDNLAVVEPMGYIDFMGLVNGAAYVLTDSGGIQEETTVLGVPCLTMRENTERPVTITSGTNALVGLDLKKILKGVTAALKKRKTRRAAPRFWDGRAAARITAILGKQLL